MQNNTMIKIDLYKNIYVPKNQIDIIIVIKMNRI